jgi:hypothetical protein
MGEEQWRKLIYAAVVAKQGGEVKPAKALVLLTMTLFLIFSLLPTGAAASSSGDPDDVDVAVLAAGYLDLDSDDLADDVFTSFNVEVPHNSAFRISYIYAFLEKPSGTTYVYVLKVTSDYSELRVGLGWFNAVTEEGWYLFYVYVVIMGQTHSHWGYDEVCFDPPTEGLPGAPLVALLSFRLEP